MKNCCPFTVSERAKGPQKRAVSPKKHKGKPKLASVGKLKALLRRVFVILDLLEHCRDRLFVANATNGLG